MNKVTFNNEEWYYSYNDVEDINKDMYLKLHNTDNTRRIDIFLNPWELSDSNLHTIITTRLKEYQHTTGVEDISYEVKDGNLQKDLDGSEQWVYGDVRCKCCGWEWVAVIPAKVEVLECPNCNKLCGVLNDK